jgi:hypothetical protein
MLEKCVGDLQAAGVASAPSFLTPEGTFQLTTNSGTVLHTGYRYITQGADPPPPFLYA